VQRIYVRKSVHDDFLRRLEDETAALQVGDPGNDETVVGPLVNAETADRVVKWLEEARRDGAKVLRGGHREGNVITPAIVVDVKPSMRISCEEVFGPVVTVEPYDDFADAVAAVNDSPFGLQAGVFTFDSRKIDYAFRNLDVGTVLVNETSYFRIDNYPYGGVKDSGFGREGVRYAMESMTEPRVLVTAPG
jgi:glyceraldehyde-3-phosphate dehydrogenase (NADP+)